MVKGSERIFKAVKIEFGQVHIAGGFTSTPAAAKSKSIEGHDKKTTHFRENGIYGKLAAVERVWT